MKERNVTKAVVDISYRGNIKCKACGKMIEAGEEFLIVEENENIIIVHDHFVCFSEFHL